MDEKPSPTALRAGMTAEERRLMEDLVDVYDRIRAMGLRTNESELAHSIHTVQMFVINRVLHRQWPDHWSSWFYGRRLSPGRIAARLGVAATKRRRKLRRGQLWRRRGGPPQGHSSAWPAGRPPIAPAARRPSIAPAPLVLILGSLIAGRLARRAAPATHRPGRGRGRREGSPAGATNRPVRKLGV